MNATTRTSMPAPLRDYLRQEPVAQQLQDLRKLTPSRFLLAVASNYLVIGGVIAAVTSVLPLLASFSSSWSTHSVSSWGNWIAHTGTVGIVMGTVWLFGIVLIASRQHALAVLMHEGAHRTVSSNRTVNDLLSDLLCGAPLLVHVRNYRQDHLTHHQNLNTAADPDWSRKTDDPHQRLQWSFPATQPLPKMLARLYGYSLKYLLNSLAANQASPTTGTTTAHSPNWPTDKTLGRLRIGVYVVAASVLTLTGSWGAFVAFWLAPMLLVLPIIMRVRSIAEHFALTHDHPLTQSRTVRAGVLERLLIAPHHIGLHIDHHLLASVPFYNLPALHHLLLQCSYYADNAHLNEGYFVRRTLGYGNIPVEPELTTLAQDMYSLPSVRLGPILSSA